MRRSKLKLRRHFVDVRRDGVGGGHRSVAGFEIAALDHLENFLDRLAVQRACAADAFESVVFGRIVAAGDHDGAVGVQVLRRMIEHRRGDRADVGDVATGGQQSFEQRIAQARGAEPAIAADVDLWLHLRDGADRCPGRARAARRQELRSSDIRDAADIVLAENGRLEHTL